MNLRQKSQWLAMAKLIPRVKTTVHQLLGIYAIIRCLKPSHIMKHYQKMNSWKKNSSAHTQVQHKS